METKNLIAQHQKLIKEQEQHIRLLCFIQRGERIKSDLIKKMEIEEEKDPIESYILTPKSWYLNQLQKVVDSISWAQRRYSELINKKAC